MNNPVIELLVNPFCMAERDVGTIKWICDKHDVSMQVYNLWEIDDGQLDTIPSHISSLIREWRSGKRPGSVYSTVFVNGAKIPLNAWHGHLNTVSDAIKKSLEGGEHD